jgi:hypothetical protein
LDRGNLLDGMRGAEFDCKLDEMNTPNNWQSSPTFEKVMSSDRCRQPKQAEGGKLEVNGNLD